MRSRWGRMRTAGPVRIPSEADCVAPLSSELTTLVLMVGSMIELDRTADSDLARRGRGIPDPAETLQSSSLGSFQLKSRARRKTALDPGLGRRVWQGYEPADGSTLLLRVLAASLFLASS